jgi:hypothetical protein
MNISRFRRQLQAAGTWKITLVFFLIAAPCWWISPEILRGACWA